MTIALALGLLCAGSASAQQRTGTGGGGGFGGAFGGGGTARSTTGGSTSGTSTRDYPNSTLPGNATFQYDPETHSLIVMTDDKTFTNITQIVKSLDKPKPQVLIKVVFIEIQHDNDLDFGIEGSYTPHSLSGNTAVTAGLTNVFGLAGLGATGQTIGQSTMPYGAGLYSIMGSDYNATIRAIASASKVEVLSRPSIMVRNNQPATITVGQSVPIINGATAPSVGVPQTPIITYQNVGIILQVTPFISADGLVEMIVAPQISDLSGTTVQIATNIASPVIDLRSASTVVVTPDGQTVVIGGLMEHDRTTIDSKIPLLGDIPVLGYLFTHKQSANTKKELMIFLTPHVVNFPSQIAANTQGEIHTNDLGHQDFGQKELDEYFDKLPQKTGAKTTIKN